MLTRSKIAYDLNISPHKTSVVYDDSVIEYVFSSNLYKESFLNKITEHREKIGTSLSNRFGFNIKCDKLADLKLYDTIEKRGFLINVDGEKIECLKHIILDGNNQIMRM